MSEAREKERLFQDILAFIRTPSRSCPDGGEEGALQAEVARRMRALGARVRVFEADDVPGFREHPLCHGPGRRYAGRPTVVGEIGPPEAPALLLLAHSDTVEISEPDQWTVEPFEGAIRDGFLIGLGAGDDKWGLATMLSILEALQSAATPLRKRVLFASTIDEENGVANGMLLLMLAGIRAEAALYLDGCELGVCIGCNGGSNLELHPRIPLAPAGRERHRRALEETARVMSRRRQPLFDQPFFRDNVARDSSVRFAARQEDDAETFILRFYNPAGEDRQAFRGELEAAVRAALGGDLAGYALHYREPWFEPALISEETPIVRHLASGVSQATGRPARISTVSKQDSFLLTNHAGIPTVSFGVGRVLWPGGHHAPDEAIRLEDAWQGCLAAHAAVRRWLVEESP